MEGVLDLDYHEKVVLTNPDNVFITLKCVINHNRKVHYMSIYDLYTCLTPSIYLWPSTYPSIIIKVVKFLQDPLLL